MAFAFTTSSMAERKNGRSGDDGGKKCTIRGVGAGFIAEGEFTLGYRHNRAVEAEAAFLTVVVSSEESKRHKRATGR
jgi:hypothetical protein